MNSNGNVVFHDAIDKIVYDDLLAQAPALKAVVDGGEVLLKTFGPLSADVFYSLYKPSPEMIDKVPPEYLLNKEELIKLTDSQVYKELRDYTVLDDFGAGLGCKALLESLVRQFQEDPSWKDLVDKINHVTDAQQVAEDYVAGRGECSANMDTTKEAIDDIQRILATLQSSLRRTMDYAAGHAVEEVEAVDEVITAWGLDKGGFERLSVDKKLALLSVLKEQKKFRDMGKLVGRMRNIAITSRKVKVDQARVELHSITVGDDISRLLPQELAALRKPALKLDFYRRWSEKQLMQYDLRHNEPKGQGPIIALIDSSGSMRKDTREEWSKALALGLAEIAARERRGFAYALFAGENDELICDEFTLGYPAPAQLLALAQGFIGGGTDFDKPLKFALAKLHEAKFHHADIVLITDGECVLSEAFFAELIKEKATRSFRIYSILIGHSPCELSRWSDEVWSINDLLDDSTADELFEKL